MLAHYCILEQIGAGGMGVVYRAHDLQLDRDVALKVLTPGTLGDKSSRSRFRREALALARLNHPNIATVHEYGTHEGIDFLVTEYIPGITLDTKLAAGPLPVSEALNLGIQIARGLKAAHEQGIIHRDLKPGNLRINANGQVKILDFGLATFALQVNATALTESYSGEKASYGTLPYMAPEQVRGARVDERSDIWAAGTVLYEMVTGQRPFPEKHVPQLIDDILHQAVKSPISINPAVPSSLESIILKTLDKEPERRYQSARELGVDLDRLHTSPLSLTSDLPMARTAKARLRKPAVVIGAVLSALILLVLATVMRRVDRDRVQAPRILAVLPFQAVGVDTGTAALGTGMTATLTTLLAQASDHNLLQLVSTREIEAEGVRSASDARREFGADLVVEGSLQQVGSQLRINYSLVDTATHREVAARTITATAGDIFGLEDRVATEALSLLSTQVPAVKHAVIEIHADTDPEAYQHYLRGVGYLEDYDKVENIQSAITEFGLAVEKDSRYPQAYAGLGNAYWLGYSASSNGSNNWLTRAAENCQKALDISSEIAEGHSCLGHVYVGQGHYAKGVEEFKRAVQLDSNRDDALRGLADAYEKMGDAAAAEATYQKAIALRPKYWAGYSWMGAFYFREARYQDAATMFRKVVELTPESFIGYSNLGGALSIQGQYPEAIKALQRSIEIRPTLEGYINLGDVYFASRNFAEAARVYKQALTLNDQYFMAWGNLGDALYWTPDHQSEAEPAYRKAISLGESKLQTNPRDSSVLAFLATYRAMINDRQNAIASLNRALVIAPNDADVQFRAALVYNHLGDTDRTLSSLDKAVSLGYPAAAIRDTPDFDTLRGNPRFQAMTAKPSQKN